MKRDHWLRHIERLDPERDFEEIQSISVYHEFPWDTIQALGFALYRTYAVPSVGRLLAETAELTEHSQKRYDDTVLLLDAVGEHGFASQQGREAVRRMNQMHRRYDISNDDFRYVLATFVVVPKRWMDAYGWRPHSQHEVRALTNYYRALGKHMNIQDIPETYEEFERLLDDYEREHFAYDEGGVAVSDATLDLIASWYPGPLGKVMRAVSVCLMDDALLKAFGYRPPNRLLRSAARGALRLRGRAVRLLPPRRKAFFARQSPNVRGYKGGYRLAELGTFAPGTCPVPHAGTAVPAAVEEPEA
ncbi:oxygenase MpaB family protein [Streptomyces sp. NPDC046805]|uniref:oxygenase MpaB family protein n=1 Tax=Streptomyces sp. NPDC046805 TaxID=3155134 RepID=UPI0033C90738